MTRLRSREHRSADWAWGRSTVGVLLLVAAGAVLLAYGLRFNATAISTEGQGSLAVQARAEADVIKEVSVGGLERDDSGQIKKTYKETEKAPQACPT